MVGEERREGAGVAWPGSTIPVSAAESRYLEAIYYLHHEGEQVRPGRLAEWLGVSPPTVTEALRRLGREGWVQTGPSRTVLFTVAGHRAAAGVVRRHRVAEVWLSRTLGLDWVTADAEAHRIAHSLSDLVLDRLQRSLGDPRTCPHGNAIPGVEQPHRDLTCLAELAAGVAAVVSRISEVAEHDAPELLTVLYTSGLVPGTRLQVAGTAGGSGVLAIRIRGRRTVHLSVSAARSVWVETSGAAAGTG